MGYSLMMDQVQHQVVEKVLQGYLDGEDLNSAVKLWDRQYSNQPMDKLSFFVFEIATSSTLRSLRKQILSELEEQLIQEKTQEEIPTVAVQQAAEVKTMPIVEAVAMEMKQAQQDSQVEAIVNSDALNDMFAGLLSALKSFDQKELLSVFDEYLQDVQGIPGFIRDELLLVAFSNHQVNYLMYDEQHIRTALNVIYSVVCEYIGPVKADRLFSTTVAQVEQKYPLESMVRFL